ncbi:Nn.00g027280.m01.CDS01 [Neocucurbitaria sp. VM-36]
MESLATPSRISRFDLRFRHRPQFVPLKEEPQPKGNEKEGDIARQGLDEEPRERVIMTLGHRIFHRRAAQAAVQVVTVNVDVVATVDSNGNLVAQETVTQQDPTEPTIAAAAASVVPAPAVPSVPAVPTAALPSVPSVPSVPPFPSDLVVPSVPAFPWPSGVSVAEVAASASPTPAASTAAPTSAPGNSVVPVPISGINPNTNSTIASTAALLSTSSFTSLESGSLSPSRSLSLSLSAHESSSPSTRASLSGMTTPSISGSTATASDAAATSYYGGGGGVGNPAAPPAATTAAVADAGGDSSPAPLETPQVVGSIVGSLAGAALILAIVLLLIRRHKRKRNGALQLTGDDHTDNDQQVMRQAPARSSLVPSAFLHRFSGMSRSTVETNTSGGERSFQRVSGRKLPSAFSEGMTSEQFSRGGTISGSSFYQDDQGTYGGPGLPKEFGKEIGDTSNVRSSGPMNIRPSPARTPVIRHPDDAPPFGTSRSHLSPPQSPNPDFPARGTLGRSLPSADGSRSSRFTENV